MCWQVTFISDDLLWIKKKKRVNANTVAFVSCIFSSQAFWKHKMVGAGKDVKMPALTPRKVLVMLAQIQVIPSVVLGIPGMWDNSNIFLILSSL